MKRLQILAMVAVSLCVPLAAWSQAVPDPQSVKPATVNETNPGLASSALTFAVLGDLPAGVLLRCGATDITAQDLEGQVTKAPEGMRGELGKNGFFLLEQMAARKLLLELATKQAAEAKKDIASTPEEQILQDYFEVLVGQVTATEEEIAKFYAENKDACGGATLDQMKDQLKQYVAKQKQQDAVQEHIRTLGQRMPILVSAAWAGEQAVSAKDNPVDRARASGKPTMVDFGASGCRPCEMMTPILADLKKKYEGKANVLFVHVREQQILASRYGIGSIPAQVFFDKDGKESHRHTGFFPQAEIEKKLAEMGVQ